MSIELWMSVGAFRCRSDTSWVAVVKTSSPDDIYPVVSRGGDVSVRSGLCSKSPLEVDGAVDHGSSAKETDSCLDTIKPG